MEVHKDASNVRLGRLIKTGLCPAEKARKYAVELKSLVDRKSSEKNVRETGKLFKALSDPTRLRILKILKIRGMCVCEIMIALGLTQPTVSHHLNILEDAGLINKKRQGKWIFHNIANNHLLKLVEQIELIKR